MADENYTLPKEPVYRETIRLPQNSDPVDAEEILAPLFRAMLDNTHFVKLLADALSNDKQDNISGEPGQVVGFNEAGKPVPQGTESLVGPAGEDGAAAGFGTPTATVNSGTGTPSVTVTSSGPDTAKVFAFVFENLKGATGTRGSQIYYGTAITGTSTTGTVFSESSISSALVNDLYLNTSTWNVYKCTTAGAASAAKWAYVGNIKGADGDSGSGGGVGKSMAGETVKPTSTTTVTASEGAEVFNDLRNRYYSGITPMAGNVASGSYSHAEGNICTAIGIYSHAEGFNCYASGKGSHAEGTSAHAVGNYSHAEGGNCYANEKDAHAEGSACNANGESSHAEGSFCTANGIASHAGGFHCLAKANCQTAIGKYNVESTVETDRFILGKGASDTARANCFRVTDTGVFATGQYASSGADYAELFEWQDGNPDAEDRAGRFVTLDGEKIRLAGPEDDFILGIISGNSSVIGDVHDDQWQGMYLYDIFGRPLWEDVEVPDETIEEPDPDDPEKTVTRVVIPAHMEHRQKRNLDYDSSKPYVPRTQRPEWGCVGMLGKLVVIDNGECHVNGWCRPGEGGIAVPSETPTKFRMMSRVDATHIRVLVL